MTRTGAHATSTWAQPGTTLALSALTLVATTGLFRFQAQGSFVGPILAVGLVAHGIAWARRRWPRRAARLPWTTLAVLLVVSWTVLAETTVYGIPLAATWSAAVEAISGAGGALGLLAPGTPDPRGVLIGVMVITAVGALAADRAAFAMRSPFLAIGPSFALFLLGALAATSRGVVVVAYLAVLLVFLAQHEHDMRSGSSWRFHPPPQLPARALRPSLVLGMVVVAGAVVLGPRLPGAGIRPLNGPGSSSAEAAGVEVDPFVEMRTTLTDRSTTEMFSVSSSAASYWRLTSLDRFDGSTWSSSGTIGPVAQLPEPGGAHEPGSVVQEFLIAALESPTLPVAARPQGFGGVPASYDAGSATLTAEARTSTGSRYRAVSVAPRPDPRLLAGGGSSLPSDIVGRYLDPSGVPAAVIDEARRVTARAVTPGSYGAALALQDHFRHNFTYDLSVVPGHDGPALERFLFETRRGYCEQFAGAFAAMARVVGLPARVAVGFTPGMLGNDGRYHVQGLDAHAWPEVYFAGVGWMAFEPTPGRAVPGGEAYTGVPDSQLIPQPSASSAVIPPTPTTAVSQGPTSTAPLTSPEVAEPARPGSDGLGQPRGDLDLPLEILVPVVLGATYLAVVPQLERRRQRRRRAGAVSAGDRVLLAWIQAAEALAGTGARRRPAETLLEFAGRAPAAAGLEPGSAASLLGLVKLASAASYGGAVASEEASAAALAASAVVEELKGRACIAVRLARAVDPRPVRLVDAGGRRSSRA